MHEALRGNFILRGGTALHMFHAPMQRLSVDLDLIYCGDADLGDQMADTLESVPSQFGIPIPKSHFFPEFMFWEVAYTPPDIRDGSCPDTISGDLIFRSETLLYPPQWIASHALGLYRTQEVLTAHPYDVAAGKLNALTGRIKARDLYDVSMISQLPGWDTRLVQDSFIMAQAKQGRDVRWDFVPKGLGPVDNLFLMHIGINPIPRYSG